MEELLSTEALDREILEDARKKAYKILKTADDSLAVHVRDWEQKTRDAVNSVQKTYAEQTKKTEDEILARLPLDKRRLRSETAENFLNNAIDNLLRSLGREKLLAILEKELAGRLSAFTGGEGEVLYSGMNREEAKGILNRTLAARQGGQNGDWDLKEDPRDHRYPSVVIQARTMKISASVEDAARTMMKEKRAELASALLGEGVLND